MNALKNLILFIILATQEALTLDKNKDGKVSTSEVFTSLLPVAAEAPDAYASLKEAKEAIKNLTYEQRQSLVVYFKTEFNLADEKGDLEDLIEESIEFIANGAEFLQKTIAFVKSRKDQAQVEANVEADPVVDTEVIEGTIEETGIGQDVKSTASSDDVLDIGL